MTATSTAGGARRTGLILLVVSLFAGLGMAFAAAATIVASNGPKDAVAVVEGEQVVLSPDQLLNYGG
jgi:hypothetical protein